MICKKCGRKIYDKAVKCPHCGTPTENAQPKKPEKKESTVNGFAIAGSLLGIAGFIVSKSANFKKRPQNGNHGAGIFDTRPCNHCRGMDIRSYCGSRTLNNFILN